MSSRELYSIREWTPLTHVMETIPARVQKGLLPADLNLTAIDAIPQFLAIGSDAGIVFWYNRYNGDVEKLRTESSSRITCVKIVDSVEYMVAAGGANSQVSVFQIQKRLPEDLNLVAPCTRAKPIQRYTIRDLHKSVVSCCEWSKNGMRLYSGDRNGIVVETEFDYQTHLSKSKEILSEAYEIVQLSVHQSYLLVSTLYRSIICKRDFQNGGTFHVSQVGKKDRKQLVDCGGTFLRNDRKDPLIICGRPGLRFWIADTEGNVEKTLLFREAVLKSPTWEIPILNPKISMNRSQSSVFAAFSASTTNSMSHSVEESTVAANNFREVFLYPGQDALVVTHDEVTMYILNLDKLKVEAVARGFRKILDFCVCGKEIFVLEGERSVLRLAPLPEKPNKTAKIIFNPLLPPPVPLLGASTASVYGPPVEYESEEQAVVNAEECFELPPIETLNCVNIPIELAVESPRAEQSRRLEIFNQIGEMDFEDSILHHSGISIGGRKSKRARGHRPELAYKSEGIVEIGQAARADSDVEQGFTSRHLTQPKTTKPVSMEASYCDNTVGPLRESAIRNGSSSGSSIQAEGLAVHPFNCEKIKFADHLPELLSPDTLQKTIASKAKSLAEELGLPTVSLGPITAEELQESRLLAAATPYRELDASGKPGHAMQLTLSSSQLLEEQKQTAHTAATISCDQDTTPTSPRLEDASVQTTPRKKLYLPEEGELEEHDQGPVLQPYVNDFSNGQPIDDICQVLRATALLSDIDPVTSEQPMETAAVSPDANLRFVPTQPISDDEPPREIGSFLLDFTRIHDPLHHASSPPNSGESNTSSEWEFLDN